MKGQGDYCDPIGVGWTDPFNWRQPTFQMYLSPQGAQQIPNPYHASGAFFNPNVEQLAWPSQKDYDPNDGWVHLAHDFGTSSTYVPNPHLVLYNRMSGVMRVFFLITQLYSNNNKATITIRFGNGSKKSALLEKYNGQVSANAVTAFTTGEVEGAVPNYFNGTTPYWTHADFVMTYDPCVCKTENSRIYIELKLASEQSLNFTINGQVNQNISPSVGNTNPTFGSAIKPVVDGFNIANNILQVKSDKKLSASSAFSAVLGIYAGPWAGLADYLLAFINPNKPSTPAPMMFDVKLEGLGSINWQGLGKTAIIANPGSNTSQADPVHIPPYNHILGTYNLLYPPYVTIRKGNNGAVGVSPLDCDIETTYYQIECLGEIQWVYNSYMSLSWVDWRAAYVVTLSNGKRILTEDFPLGCFSDYKPVFKAEKRRGGCNYTEPYPVNVQIQLLAKSWHSNGIESIFVQVYNTTNTWIGVEWYTILQPSKPDPACNTVAQPSSWSATYGNCNYSNYPYRVNSLSRHDSIPEAEYLASVAKNSQLLIVKANPTNNQLSISPNPINEMGAITCELSGNSQISIYLTDISGKIVKSFIQNEFREKGSFILDFLRSDLSAGMYFVVMETNAGRVTQKLMLK